MRFRQATAATIRALSDWFEILENKGLEIRYPKEVGELLYEDEKALNKQLNYQGIYKHNFTDNENYELLSDLAKKIVSEHLLTDVTQFSNLRVHFS